MNIKRIVTNTLRLVVAAAVLSFVVDALRSEFFGSLLYFTYTGSLVIAVLLTLVVARRVDERHLVLALGIATVIHVVYIGLLVGPGGVLADLRSGGLEKLVLHYLTPYALLVDLMILSQVRRYRYRDTVAYVVAIAALFMGLVLVLVAAKKRMVRVRAESWAHTPTTCSRRRHRRPRCTPRRTPSSSRSASCRSGSPA